MTPSLRSGSRNRSRCCSKGLAKVSSLVPFIMLEWMAKTDPYQQITDTIGSGPFKFVREEFEPGHQAVYVKNNDYVPRSESPDWASAAKSPSSTGSNGWSSPSPLPPPPRLAMARSIGGRTRPQTL